MRTICADLAGVLVDGRPDLAEALSPFGVTVGTRMEVDLDALGASDVPFRDQLCQVLSAYQSQARALRVKGTGASGAPGRYVVTRRAVVDDRVRNTRKDRVDLREHYNALESLPLTGDLIREVTSAAPDADRVADLAHLAGGEATWDAEEGWQVRVPLTGQVLWPEVLGGAPRWAELSRSVTVVVRHTPGNDRRVRRLVRVLVEVDELFPDPQPFRDALPDLADAGA